MTRRAQAARLCVALACAAPSLNLLPSTSEAFAVAWAPFVETSFEASGPERTMSESNFPVDRAGVSYRVLWNTYKRIAARYSAEEQAQLCAGMAIRA